MHDKALRIAGGGSPLERLREEFARRFPNDERASKAESAAKRLQ